MECDPMNVVLQYGLNLLVTLDMAASAILLGKPGDTISARLGRAMDAGAKWPCPICAVLNRVISKNHCPNAAKDNGKSITAQIWNWGGPDTPDL
jgi:hypothetical protein